MTKNKPFAKIRSNIEKKLIDKGIKKKTEEVVEKVEDVVENPKEYVNTGVRKVKDTVQGVQKEIKREIDKSFVASSTIEGIKGTAKGFFKAAKANLDSRDLNLENRAKTNPDDQFANTYSTAKHKIADTASTVAKYWNNAKKEASKEVTFETVMPGYDSLLNIIEEETTTTGNKESKFSKNNIEYEIMKSYEKKSLGKDKSTLSVTTTKIEDDEELITTSQTAVFLAYTNKDERNYKRILAKVAGDTETILESIGENTTTYKTTEQVSLDLGDEKPLGYERRVVLEDQSLTIFYTPTNKEGFQITIRKDMEEKSNNEE